LYFSIRRLNKNRYNDVLLQKDRRGVEPNNHNFAYEMTNDKLNDATMGVQSLLREAREKWLSANSRMRIYNKGVLRDAGGCATRRIIMTSLLGAAAFLTPGEARYLCAGCHRFAQPLALVKSHDSTSHLPHYRQVLTEIELGHDSATIEDVDLSMFYLIFLLLSYCLVVTYYMASYSIFLLLSCHWHNRMVKNNILDFRSNEYKIKCIYVYSLFA
jgi:hypothetical protein